MNIIGFVGFAGCGKNTAGDYLVGKHAYSAMAFADPLKDCLSVIFGWDRKLLEGDTEESRKWREEVDPWWAQRLEIPRFSPRFAMQNFGTDVMRKVFHDQIWLINMERRLLASSGPVVICDCRFPNEIQLVRKLGGLIYRVRRGHDPIWMDTAAAANSGDQLAQKRLQEVFSVHQSEWAWIGEHLDGSIRNDGSLDDLYENIERTVLHG